MTFYDSAVSSTARSNGLPTSSEFMRSNGGNARKSSTAEMAEKDEMFADDLLHAYEDRFCTYESVDIFVTTFNVNGRSPPRNLKEWLSSIDDKNAPDLVIIGLQEMDLALGSYVVDNMLKESEWLASLQYNLPDAYRLVSSIRLIGIFLVVFSHVELTVRVSDVHLSSIPTGFLNFGNKGGVGISLRLNDTHICLINSHLAAGNELDRRNQDYRLISQMRFTNGFGIFDHDAVIWLGDLNYRLNIQSYDQVIKQIKENRFAQLFYFDQLKEQQRTKVAFNGFLEQQPGFVPTYKFDPGTNNWDTSEKKRIPAWCDRILYWIRDNHVRLEQKTYHSAHGVLFSDHKPVLSTFRLQVKKFDRVKRNAIYEQLLRELDKRQNELLPQISLSRTEFHFGTVHFDQPSMAVLSITNTGQTPTHFFLTPATPGAVEHEKWLTITPQSSFLDIGATAEITLQILVFDEAICGVPAGDGDRAELNTIVIVKLRGGRDYFIVIDAEYKKQHQEQQREPQVVHDLITFD